MTYDNDVCTSVAANSNAVCSPGGSHRGSHAELDPLVFYESASVGKEFVAFVPAGNQRRAHEARRDELIVKSWRGVPARRGEHRVDGGLNAMRNSETQRIVDSERMFLIVLATMTVLLGSIFAYFVMNFGF